MFVRRFAQPQFLYETPADGGGGAPAPGGENGGQGGGDDTALYQSYLEGVPEELHPLVLDPLRAQNRDFTRRFQDHSGFRQQWEPFSQIEGLTDLKPEEVAELVDFRNSILSDPQAFQQWLSQVVTSTDPQGNPLLGEDVWAQLGETHGWFDGAEGEEAPEGEDMPEWAQKMVERNQQLEQQFQQFTGQQELQQLAQQDKAQQEARMGELERQHFGEEGMDDDTHDLIVDLAIAAQHQNPKEQDPIGVAFERFMRMRGQKEGDEIESRLGQQNGQALNGGQPDTAPPKLSWNGDGMSPKDAALARVRG